MDEENAAIVAQRRALLKAWIEERFQGKQSLFREATGINQGELSGLLNEKSFGEKKARGLEKSAKMPHRYLDGATLKAARGDQGSELQDLKERVDSLSIALSALLKVSSDFRPVEFEKVVEAMQGTQLLDMSRYEPLQEALKALKGKDRDAKPAVRARAKL